MSGTSKLRRAGLLILTAAALGSLFLFLSWSVTVMRLKSARVNGVYPSPAEGMMAQIESGYVGIQEARIVSSVPEEALGAGTSHVWFVIACVWADSRTGGDPVGSSTHDFDFPGSYFVDTQDGWVLMPESSLPLLVGFWMKVFGLAGDHPAQPVFDPSVRLKPPCVRQID